MSRKHVCPKCGSKTFETTAHVMQLWTVDDTGGFIAVQDDCVQVTRAPDNDNIWICVKCGAEAITVEEE